MRRIVLFTLTLLIGLAGVVLGIWQLGRHAERAAANRLALAGRTLPVVRAGPGGDSGFGANRRVTLTGTLDEPREFLLRNHLIGGVPAVLIVTPLRPAGSDTAILLNRGYVPAPDAVDPGSASWSESGRTEFTGTLLEVPNRGDGDPITRNGRESWRALDLEPMRARLPYPLARLYLVVEPDSNSDAHTIRGKRYPFRAEPPPMDQGPHLSYALQWFGIAVAVVAFGIFFILKPSKKSVNGEQ